MIPHVKHLPASERRAVTVETVIKLAAERNPSDITTAAIAERMGLTQGAVFRHFPNKDAILQAVIEWVAERLLFLVDKAARAMFMAHVNFIIEHPGIPRILFGELQHAGETIPKRIAQTLTHRYRERLHRLIERGKTNKELDANLDREAAAFLFIGMIQGLVMQSLLANDVGRIMHDAPRVFAIFRQGIRNTQ